jgi:hypothetical protein
MGVGNPYMLCKLLIVNCEQISAGFACVQHFNLLRSVFKCVAAWSLAI